MWLSHLPLRDFILDRMVGEGTVAEGEVTAHWTDSPEEAVAHIRSRNEHHPGNEG